MGLRFRKSASKGIDSYFLGGRKTPWWVLGASGMASNFDITGTMINTALIFAIGLNGFFIEIRGGICLIMAFLLAFMGKWNRRAGVMTVAEWMKFRFGEKRDGRAARIIGAVSQIVFTIAMVTYFCVGAGSFVAEYFHVPSLFGLNPRFIGSLVLIGVAMVYTVTSGFQGVVWVDVFQSVLVFVTLMIISVMVMKDFALPETFHVSCPLKRGGFEIFETTRSEWVRLLPHWKLDLPETSSYSYFNLFGFAIVFYLIRLFFEGAGGGGGYMTQRFFASRSDREAGLVAAFWTFLLSFRWLFITSIAIIGIYYLNDNPRLNSGGLDPEKILPLVINHYIPSGLKGLLMAGLIAASMSTFDSTVNAGASYWVKDIYQTYINPKASGKKLIFQSRLASMVIVVLALLFSLTIRNINEIWGWITMALGAGLLIPMLARWYWWRLNGWGFAGGALAGMIAALLLKFFYPFLPEYLSFIIVNVVTFFFMMLFTYMNPPTDTEVLKNFYKKTRPFGFWRSCLKGKRDDEEKKTRKEHRNDLIALFLALPWQMCLFMLWMALISRAWPSFVCLLMLTAIFSILLYKYWYKNLNDSI